VALSGRLLLLALSLALVALGCRRFDVCGTAEQPCERSPGAENLGGAGAGGEPDPSSDCTATRANCDRSTLNGCETDLQSHPRHCGACDQECVGVCTTGTCVPFEERVPELYRSSANVLVTASAAYFIGQPGLQLDAMSVGRYDLESGEVAWIIEDGWSDVTALAATATRLYILGDDSLYSWSFADGELRDEGLIWAESVSASGTTVAAVAYGEAYVRSGDDGPFTLVPDDFYALAVAATRSSVFIARDASNGFSVEELSVLEGTRDVIATGTGYARALTVEEFSEAYVIVESEFASQTLHRIESPGISEPLVEFSTESLWLLTTSPSPLSGRAWVGTYSEGSRKGLRMAVLRNQPFFAEWPTVGVVEGLSASGTELWFVDPLRHALVSIDLEAMIAPAIAVPLGD
jgi:hypothetical protein